MVEETLAFQYNRAVLSWQRSISEFEEAVNAHARATADYKQARGRLIVRIKFEEPKTASLLLEAQADADDAVAALLHQRLIAEATVDGLKARLLWHRAQADNLRTQVVDEREQNRLSSSVGAGPGGGQVPAGAGRSYGSGQAGRGAPAPSQQQGPPTRQWNPRGDMDWQPGH